MELFDEGLKGLMGDRYNDGENVPVAEYELCQEYSAPKPPVLHRIATAVKWPGFFMALCCFIGWTENKDLMDAVIAVPGMCVCAACFGWHVHK